MLESIRHVVLLALENRSFDHLLGDIFSRVPNVDGVDPAHRRSNFDDEETEYVQEYDPDPEVEPDPAHDTRNVLSQISDDNSGFVLDYAAKYQDATERQRANIMKYYRWNALPALHGLAENFVVCDRWFSSVPGPTWANRFFMLSGTSLGWVEMPRPLDPNLHDYNQTTIFDRLDEKQVSWRVFAGDFPLSWLFTHQRRVENTSRYRELDLFERETAKPEHEFPAFVFIEPPYIGSDRCDDHPPADPRRSQVLLARIYLALRGNPELWHSTLFAVTYDEHGGFYDHVHPPAAVPPDAHHQEYDFKKLGVRVPTLLVSPLLPKGRPFKQTCDHTSLLNLLIARFGLGDLGARTQAMDALTRDLPAMLAAPRPDSDFADLDEVMRRLAALELGSAPEAGSDHEERLLSVAESVERELLAPAAAPRARRAPQDLATRRSSAIATARTIMRNPPRDPNRGLLGSLEREVAENGFEEVWGRRFMELAAAHGSFDDHLAGERLLRLINEDPKLRSSLQAARDRAPLTLEAPKRGLESSHPGEFKAALRASVRAKTKPLADVLEANGEPMQCLERERFENWGRTVENTPALTVFPKTKIGVCRLVKWAKAKNLRVRVSGYRHTWSNCFSQDEHVMISLLPLHVVDELPAEEPPMDPRNELQGIQIVGEIDKNGVKKVLCKIGAATTNEQFRRWCLDKHGGASAWTLPLNVIMVEITFGGSNAPMCHGAGRHQQTLSDLVHEIEFVNALGELQVVRDPQQLRAAAGCFGLLGIVTSLTLELDPMRYALMRPEKPRVALAIPPPKGFNVPEEIDVHGLTDADFEAARSGFVDRCEHHYYLEWFWFPYQKDCWVNTWRADGIEAEARGYPNPIEVAVEQAQEYLAHVLNGSIMKLFSGRKQAELFAGGAMSALPSGHPICTSMIDALHFRRGIQNMRVLDMELEIPIPAVKGHPNQPDWSICQRAWWIAIDKIYANEEAPVRIALEMRIMGGSNMIMAPQRGNDLGTCSIEVLTTPNTPKELWQSFMQELIDAWMDLKDGNGAPLDVRPHWAKQWQGTKMRGMPALAYLRQVAYRDQISQFMTRLAAIAKDGNHTLADLQARFSNPLLDKLFF